MKKAGMYKRIERENKALSNALSRSKVCPNREQKRPDVQKQAMLRYMGVI